jgi:hypothetical protein
VASINESFIEINKSFNFESDSADCAAIDNIAIACSS